MFASFECFGSGPEYFQDDNAVWHCSFLRGFSYLIKASVCVTAEGHYMLTQSHSHRSTCTLWKTNSIILTPVIFTLLLSKNICTSQLSVEFEVVHNTCFSRSRSLSLSVSVIKYYNLKYLLSIGFLIYFKMFLFFYFIYSCDGKANFSAAITPVFSVTSEFYKWKV